jgi:hypothetical protein
MWILVAWSGNINANMVISALYLQDHVLFLVSILFHGLIPLVAPAIGFEVYRKMLSESVQQLDRSKIFFVGALNFVMSTIASVLGLFNGEGIINQMIWFIACNILLVLFYITLEYFARSLKSR